MHTQVAPNTNHAHTITLSNTLFSSGVTIANNTIKVAQSGFYNFDVRIQVTSTNASLKSMLMWFRKNSNNVPYSSVRFSTSENSGFNVLTNSQGISLTPDDTVTLHYAVDDVNLFISSAAQFDSAPNVASIQVKVTQPSL